MPEALTYTTLVQDVQTYAERSDAPFVTQIPRLIMLAENRLASEIKCLGYLRFVNTTLNHGVSTLTKPNRWRETHSVTINTVSGRKVLFEREYDYCRVFWPDTTVQGEPSYFADYDYDHWFVVGTPDQNYPVEIAYYERPQPLDEDNQTNWITQYAPQLLLYAVLLEAQPFLKNSERIQEFQMLYDRAAETIVKENTPRGL